MKRNRTIDFTKGVLMLLVLIGHLFVIPVVDSVWKWMIYGFHMPLFLGVSGYLYRPPERTSILGLIQKYGIRLLAPWAVAFVFFTAAFCDVTELRGLAKAILHPWYHLWFVPVLFIYFCLAAISKLRPSIFLLLALATSVVAQYFFGSFSFPGYLDSLSITARKFVLLAGDERLYTLCFFFAWGTFVKSRSSFFARPKIALSLSAGALVTFTLWFNVFLSPSFLPIAGSFLALNTCLIGCLPYLFSELQLHNRLLEHLGRESLYYYLWHPAVFYLCKELIYPDVSWPVASIATLGVALSVLYMMLMLLRRLNPRPLLQTAFGFTD